MVNIKEMLEICCEIAGKYDIAQCIGLSRLPYGAPLSGLNIFQEFVRDCRPGSAHEGDRGVERDDGKTPNLGRDLGRVRHSSPSRPLRNSVKDPMNAHINKEMHA